MEHAKHKGMGAQSRKPLDVAVGILAAKLKRHISHSKFYCLWQGTSKQHQATHTQNRVKTTLMWATTCFTYLGWSF